MNAKYVSVMEVMPPANKAVTIDQLTAIQFTLRHGRQPHADFAVFGEHGTRRARAMAFKGLITAPGGTLHTVEILGPPNLESWKESYDCLFTGLIVLGAVRRPQLAACRSKICLLHAQYGPKCWGLLYQADVRCHTELMDTLRYSFHTKHNAALTQGLTSTFDTTRPWDSVWASATFNTEFWETDFKHPALMIATNTARSTDVVESDAAVASTSSPAAMIPAPAADNRGKRTAAPKAHGKGVCMAYNRWTCHGTSCHNKAVGSICAQYARTPNMAHSSVHVWDKTQSKLPPTTEQGRPSSGRNAMQDGRRTRKVVATRT